MRKIKNLCKEEILEPFVADPKAINQVAKDVCDRALNDARSRLHSLLQTEEVENLDRRCEFLQAFKRGLEEGIARQLVFWQPCIQAVFQFNDVQPLKEGCWDSTVHLLVAVAQPLNTIRTLAPLLDRNIVKHLKQWNWSRFRMCKSILEIQQATPDELRLGLGYGAMFASVYNVPVRVWPLRRRSGENSLQ